jgi:uncharacterized protein
MQIGVVSDTHGHVSNTRAAVQMLQSFEIKAVLHCGDIGSTVIVPLFANWPTHFVFGNVDGRSHAGELRKAIEQAGQSCHGRFGSLELGGVKIALIHGDDERLLDETIAGGAYGLVCHGHTHVPRNEKIGNTLVLNPGALYRASRHTIAIVTLPTLQIETIQV